MGEYGRETIGELLLGCLYYYGMLWLLTCAVITPIYLAISNACEDAFYEKKEDSNGGT